MEMFLDIQSPTLGRYTMHMTQLGGSRTLSTSLEKQKEDEKKKERKNNDQQIDEAKEKIEEYLGEDSKVILLIKKMKKFLFRKMEKEK